MRLLLTSGGVSNATIHDALLDMLGRPIEDCTALCIPTAMYGHPHAGPGQDVWEFVAGRSEQPMVELGWKSVGLIELTALPSIAEERWVPLVRAADVLLVSGGDALYLCHWMRESGLTDLLPQLDNTVWIGMSAGSMVTTPRVRQRVRRLDAIHRQRPRDSAWSTSRSSLTLITRTCRPTRWSTPRSGPSPSTVRPTRSTTTLPSPLSTAPSTSSPKATGAGSARNDRW